MTCTISISRLLMIPLWTDPCDAMMIRSRGAVSLLYLSFIHSEVSIWRSIKLLQYLEIYHCLMDLV